MMNRTLKRTLVSFNKHGGTLLFNLLNLLSFDALKGRSLDLDAVDRILVISLHKIGDVLFTTPAIRALKERFPQAALTVWVKSRAREVLEHNPHVDEVLVFDNISVARGFEDSNRFDIKSRLNFLSELRKRDFDLVVDLVGTWGTNLYSFLSKAPLRVGYDQHGFGFLLTKIISPAEGRHLRLMHLDVIRTMGAIPTREDLVMELSLGERKFAENFMRDHHLSSNGFLVGIHPGAGWDTKRWPPEHFGQLADLLVKENGARVVLFGTRDEERPVHRMMMRMRTQPTNLAGKLSLREMAAVIGKCHLFLGNDTGPTYLAEALNVPTGIFFGSTNPAYSSPLGTKCVIMRKILDCSPIGAHQYCFDAPGIPCRVGTHACMVSISAEEAYESLRSILPARPGAET
jgi:lipopolysaccharide heptosyltransferase II